ncbi:MAG: ung [Bacillota bacterium]|jgi:uracil-DNA glycosylase|nr:ung [Bacillota bacterium]
MGEDKNTMVTIGNEWDNVLKGEFEKEYYQELRKFLVSEYKSKTIFPSMYDIFNALKYTAYDDVKAVILGQDPYHEPNQAHGLCFSVKKGVPKPPSLVNIFKELERDLGVKTPNHGYLEDWAKQGVLLLNTVLTVRMGQANSHKGKGWEQFTDRVIELLNQRKKPMVFLLWGANAKSKAALITGKQHLILTAAHPSPLSAHNGFFGCRHFSKANAFLSETGEEIRWEIPEQDEA